MLVLNAKISPSAHPNSIEVFWIFYPKLEPYSVYYFNLFFQEPFGSTFIGRNTKAFTFVASSILTISLGNHRLSLGKAGILKILLD